MIDIETPITRVRSVRRRVEFKFCSSLTATKPRTTTKPQKPKGLMSTSQSIPRSANLYKVPRSSIQLLFCPAQDPKYMGFYTVYFNENNNKNTEKGGAGSTTNNENFPCLDSATWFPPVPRNLYRHLVMPDYIKSFSKSSSGISQKI